jgi:hypothetical protein
VSVSTVMQSIVERVPDAGQHAAAAPLVPALPPVAASVFLGALDSVVLGAPQAKDLGATAAAAAADTSNRGGESDASVHPGELSRSESLGDVLRQAVRRAEALMGSAAARGGADSLLVSARSGGQFVGALALVEGPNVTGRWRATFRARTDVEALRLTRDGLEAFLARNPLANVYLRATLSKSRAEILRLEALERISEMVGRASGPLAGAARGARGGGVEGLTATHDTFALVGVLRKIRGQIKKGAAMSERHVLAMAKVLQGGRIS